MTRAPSQLAPGQGNVGLVITGFNGAILLRPGYPDNLPLSGRRHRQFRQFQEACPFPVADIVDLASRFFHGRCTEQCIYQVIDVKVIAALTPVAEQR